jgi:hypothetical protein
MPPDAAFPSARTTHAMEQLADGRFLMVGGHDDGTGNAGPLRSAEIYDPLTDAFQPTGDMNEKRFRPRAIRLVSGPNAGRVLVIGGDAEFADGFVLRSTELYDPATGVFTLSAPAGDMNVVRVEHEATLLLDGRILVTGGRLGQGVGTVTTASAEIFDPLTATFALTGGPMTTPRRRHTATLLSDGRVLITGGQSQAPTGGFQSTAEIYDPATDTFSAVPGGMASNRAAHRATLLQNGRVLVVGGFTTGSAPVSGVEVYDPAANTFTAVPGGLGTPRGHHSQNLLPSGKVLILGGLATIFPSLMETAIVELYDPTAGPFGALTTLATPLSAGRFNHQSALVTSGPHAGKVLLTGGTNGSEVIGRPPEFYLAPP